MRYLTFIIILICSLTSRSQSFTEVSLEAGIDHLPATTGYMGGGCGWFDYDNDGWEDLYITAGQAMDRLYRNNGDGTFTDITLGSGLEFTELANTMGVSMGDVDHDGDQDIWVITWRETGAPYYANSYLFINQGNGLFFEVSEDAGIDDAAYSVSGGLFDINEDGWLDLFSGNYVAEPDFISENGQTVGFAHTCFEDWIYVSNQDGTYSELGVEYGVNNAGCTLAMAATDYDRNGHVDLMVINDFGQWVIPNPLYEFTGPEAEMQDVGVETGADVGIYGMGVAVGDYDEDLDLDYYITNLGRNVLLNQDEGDFVDVTDDANVKSDSTENGLLHTGWGSFFFDYDNDTRLDLFLANGHIPSVPFIDNKLHDTNILFENNGDGSFTDITMGSGLTDTLIARGCAYADYDKDGDLDIAVANIPNNIEIIPNQRFHLFRNETSGNNWAMLELVGVECNTNAIGAQVELFADDRIFLREVSGGTSHASQNSHKVHYGLGQIEEVDSVHVFWPGGEMQTAYPEINTYTTIVQGELPQNIEGIDLKVNVYPNPVSDVLNILIDKPLSRPIQLYDMSGQLVFEKDSGLSALRHSIALPPELSNGVYRLQIGGYSTSVIINR